MTPALGRRRPSSSRRNSARARAESRTAFCSSRWRASCSETTRVGLAALSSLAPFLGVPGGVGAGRPGVAVSAHHHHVALLRRVRLGVEVEAPVAPKLGEALGQAVAVVLDHGHAALGELGDHLGPLGLALRPQQGVAYGPADVVELVVDDRLGDLGQQLGVVAELEQLGRLAHADLAVVHLGPHAGGELQQCQAGGDVLGRAPGCPGQVLDLPARLDESEVARSLLRHAEVVAKTVLDESGQHPFLVGHRADDAGHGLQLGLDRRRVAAVAGDDEVGAVVLGSDHQRLDDAVGGDAGHDVRHVPDAPTQVVGSGTDELGGKVLIHGFALLCLVQPCSASSAWQVPSHDGSVGEVAVKPSAVRATSTQLPSLSRSQVA